MRVRHWTVLAVVAACAAACGGDNENAGGGAPTERGGGTAGGGAAPAIPAAPAVPGMPSPDDLGRAAETNAKTLRDMNAGKEVKAVAPADLAALLPATFGRHRREGEASQHVNSMGMDIAEAEASYPTPEDLDGDLRPDFHVKVIDIGNLKGAAAMGFTAWSMQTVDRKTASGWEKTTKVGDWPAWEEYDTGSKCGTLKVIVAKRFVVEANGNDASAERIREFVQSLDLAKLAALGK
ncbi:MAG: hypothetical protein K8T90_03710 [Planctomycetes bacterium]|nr:hypothetical protein [Planctomycetota bacterium]